MPEVRHSGFEMVYQGVSGAAPHASYCRNPLYRVKLVNAAINEAQILSFTFRHPIFFGTDLNPHTYRPHRGKVCAGQIYQSSGQFQQNLLYDLGGSKGDFERDYALTNTEVGFAISGSA